MEGVLYWLAPRGRTVRKQRRSARVPLPLSRAAARRRTRVLRLPPLDLGRAATLVARFALASLLPAYMYLVVDVLLRGLCGATHLLGTAPRNGRKDMHGRIPAQWGRVLYQLVVGSNVGN